LLPVNIIIAFRFQAKFENKYTEEEKDLSGDSISSKTDQDALKYCVSKTRTSTYYMCANK